MLSEAQIQVLCEGSASKLERLREIVRRAGSALVAFSGGVDSAFVLKVAIDELGDKAIALTALSPSVAQEEADEAVALAKTLGARHVLVHSHELDNPNYAANSSNRCYFCKTELYSLCERKKQEMGVATIFDGFNADDRKDFRPGHKAALEFSVESPLALAELTKNEIRAWSARWSLPTWDKPQMACLASRIPYGTSVTSARLQQVGGAEAELRRLGLKGFRVRYHLDVARLEVANEEYARFSDEKFRQQVNEALRRHGFLYVALDLEPFRSGRLNDALKADALRLPLLNS